MRPRSATRLSSNRDVPARRHHAFLTGPALQNPCAIYQTISLDHVLLGLRHNAHTQKDTKDKKSGQENENKRAASEVLGGDFEPALKGPRGEAQPIIRRNLLS